jgi:hypothetical protein
MLSCAGTDGNALACQEVQELLLLALAVGTRLLHAEYKGASTQFLLPSMRTTNGTAASSSSGSCSSSRGSSKRLAVSANHEELLQALLGVRQLAALPEHVTTVVAKQMIFTPLAVMAASRTRWSMVTRGSGSSRSTSANAREVVGPGVYVPWQLALPVLLTQVELLALAPSYLTEQLAALQQLLGLTVATCNQLQVFARPQHWQPGQQPPNWPSLDTVQSHLQQCFQAVWLQLGPALLSLCRRSSGEAVGEDEEKNGWTLITMDGVTLGASSSREVFATFSELLTATTHFTGECCLPCGTCHVQVGPTVGPEFFIRPWPSLSPTHACLSKMCPEGC